MSLTPGTCLGPYEIVRIGNSNRILPQPASEIGRYVDLDYPPRLPNSANPNAIAHQTTGISIVAQARAHTRARRPRLQPSGGWAIRAEDSIRLRG